MSELEDAIVLAPGLLCTPHAKVTHGLLRRSDRFAICGVIDADNAGRDAGQLLDGQVRGVPVFASLDEALANLDRRPRWCIVGIATHAGRLTDQLRELLLLAAERGMGIVNGLHDSASDDPAIRAACETSGGEIVDLRKPRPIEQLRFWNGDIRHVKAPRIAVLGSDCALGKRTTTRMLTDALNDLEIRTEMIFTGQTGWMQGGRYGFVLDSTPNDFVSGELEHAVISCDNEVGPDLMLLEGQSSLRNPSGPCGAELLLSAQARGAILQHAPARELFEGYEKEGFAIPTIESEIELIGYYGAKVLAVTLNGENLTDAELRATQREYEARLDIPVTCPLLDGASDLIAPVRLFMRECKR